MNIIELETGLQDITDGLCKENFIFDFFLAYGMSKTSVDRVKKNAKVNKLDSDGELTVKNKKFFFKVIDSPHSITLEELAESKKGIRFVVVTDYSRFCAYDSNLKSFIDIDMDELSKNYDFFLPLAGIEKALFYDEKEADVKASVKMAKLFDELNKTNSTDNEDDVKALNVFFTRLLFCLFAEDSAMFGSDENLFTNYIETVSKKDGSDLHVHVESVFNKLNSNSQDVSTTLQKFPYVNGGLFRDSFAIPSFTQKARKLLIECGSELDWSQINPDIFGSMIQAVITDEHRGGLGMHYTSVPNIMKVIEPLFLDELYEEFEKVKGNTKKLNLLHLRLQNLKIFDPACGSGNFLIIAYKELRKLEILIFKEGGLLISPSIELTQFYGIELDDFAHEVAILSLWLTEHQMNLEFKKEFGTVPATFPLQDGGYIAHGNATRLDWNEVCPRDDGDEIYILGNPPYIGTRNQEKNHKLDMAYVFHGIKNYKNLDYIACWFYIGAKYIENINAKYAFVSTNSIVQGDQVAILWSNIFSKNIEIAFAYQSFKWKNNAKNNAGVTVVIIGLENINNRDKKLYINDLIKKTKEINGYLISAPKVFIKRRSEPLIEIPKMSYGNYTGGCNELLLSPLEKDDILSENKNAQKFIRKLSGSAEFIQNKERYCLWIYNSNLEEALKIDKIKDRINQVKQNRLLSKDESLQKLADRPHQFRDLKEAKKSSIIVPIVSSERRKYIPIGFLDKEYIIPNSAQAIYDADVWIFGFISSYMHNIWMRAVAGRLEERYRYSSTLV